MTAYNFWVSVLALLACGVMLETMFGLTVVRLLGLILEDLKDRG